MKFISINLNQTISKALLAEKKQERNYWIIFGILNAVLIGIFINGLIINSSFNGLKLKRISRINEIKVETIALKKEGIDISKKDIESLNKIESGRRFWTNKFTALTEITPENMAITKIKFINNRLVISAISELVPEEKEFKVINSFLKAINAQDEFTQDFTKVKFLSSERDVNRGQEILTFKVEAKLKSSKKRKNAA